MQRAPTLQERFVSARQVNAGSAGAAPRHFGGCCKALGETDSMKAALLQAMAVLRRCTLVRRRTRRRAPVSEGPTFLNAADFSHAERPTYTG
jgi:hypothetical protein